MVRLLDLPPAQAQRLAALECPQFTTEPWVTGPPLAQRRVAIVSSAGLLVRGGVPFRGRDPDYHTIPPGTPPGDLLISHVDRKSTRLNSSHSSISYAVFCLKKKNNE